MSQTQKKYDYQLTIYCQPENGSNPWTKTFNDITHYKKFIRYLNSQNGHYYEMGYEEYLMNNSLYFGEIHYPILGDNSSFVEASVVNEDTFCIYYGVPACYKTYKFKTLEHWWHSGSRLRRLVDFLGEKQTLKLISFH